MRRTNPRYCLKPGPDGGTAVSKLYADGHSELYHWNIPMDQARSYLLTKRAVPEAHIVDEETWFRLFYQQWEPTWFRIWQHPHGGFYAEVWPFGEHGSWLFGVTINTGDQRISWGSYPDVDSVRQDLQHRYRGARELEQEAGQEGYTVRYPAELTSSR